MSVSRHNITARVNFGIGLVFLLILCFWYSLETNTISYESEVFSIDRILLSPETIRKPLLFATKTSLYSLVQDSTICLWSARGSENPRQHLGGISPEEQASGAISFCASDSVLAILFPKELLIYNLGNLKIPTHKIALDHTYEKLCLCSSGFLLCRFTLSDPKTEPAPTTLTTIDFSGRTINQLHTLRIAGQMYTLLKPRSVIDCQDSLIVAADITSYNIRILDLNFQVIDSLHRDPKEWIGKEELPPLPGGKIFEPVSYIKDLKRMPPRSTVVYAGFLSAKTILVCWTAPNKLDTGRYAGQKVMRFDVWRKLGTTWKLDMADLANYIPPQSEIISVTGHLPISNEFECREDRLYWVESLKLPSITNKSFGNLTRQAIPSTGSKRQYTFIEMKTKDR